MDHDYLGRDALNRLENIKLQSRKDNIRLKKPHQRDLKKKLIIVKLISDYYWYKQNIDVKITLIPEIDC